MTTNVIVNGMGKSKALYDPLNITKDLIKIDTRNPPGTTEKAVEYLQSLFSSFKTKVYKKNSEKPNLVVEISKGKPVLMLTSHLDTVPCEDKLLNPIIVNGKLYGRGACDAKGCVAAICYAALSANPSVGLKLAFTADEEVGGVNGLGYVFPIEKADYVIIGEPTGMDRIGVMQAMVISLDLIIKGESGHTASHDVKKGAIYKASKYIIEIVDTFSTLRGEYNKFKRFFEDMGMDFVIKGHAVFNPAIIKGGIKRNVIANRCEINADIRISPWIDAKKVRKMLNYLDLDVKVNGILKPYGMLVDDVDREKDLRLLNLLKSAVIKKSKPKAVCSLGVGDSRYVRKYGVPALYYGPGGDSTLHSDNEYVKIDELYGVAEICKEIIEKADRFL